MKTREEQIAEMAKDLEQAKYWAMGTAGSLNNGFGGLVWCIYVQSRLPQAGRHREGVCGAVEKS